jgi:hypothetical protein
VATANKRPPKHRDPSTGDEYFETLEEAADDWAHRKHPNKTGPVNLGKIKVWLEHHSPTHVGGWNVE